MICLNINNSSSLDSISNPFFLKLKIKETKSHKKTIFSIMLKIWLEVQFLNTLKNKVKLFNYLRKALMKLEIIYMMILNQEGYIKVFWTSMELWVN